MLLLLVSGPVGSLPPLLSDVRRNLRHVCVLHIKPFVCISLNAHALAHSYLRPMATPPSSLVVVTDQKMRGILWVATMLPSSSQIPILGR